MGMDAPHSGAKGGRKFGWPGAAERFAPSMNKAGSDCQELNRQD